MSTAEAKTESLYGHESTTLTLSLSAQTSNAKKTKLERVCFKDLDGYVLTIILLTSNCYALCIDIYLIRVSFLYLC